MCWRKEKGKTRVSFHMLQAKRYQHENAWDGSYMLSGLFGVWEWASTTSVTSRSNCLAKLQVLRSVLVKRSRNLGGLVPGNLMHSIGRRDRTLSQHGVRQARLYRSERGNSISVLQTSPSWINCTCVGDWELHGHKSRVRLNPYAWGCSTTPGLITVCQDAAAVVWDWWAGFSWGHTHTCGAVSTCLLLGAILLDMWCSDGELCFSLWLLHHPSAFRFEHIKLYSQERHFYRNPLLKFWPTTGVSTSFIFMSDVGTRNVSWDTVPDLQIEHKDFGTCFWVLHLTFCITNQLSQVLICVSPLMD